MPAMGGLLALVAAWWAYQPGLHGGFLFDDYANLPALGALGPVHDGPSLLRYLTSGVADPVGRPLSMASFLLDAQDWPADPLPFKRTNLVLHLLNGVLLGIFLRMLGHRVRGTTNMAPVAISGAAVLAAAIWMLHPLFVSTTLYVVQREAMLPATCSLLGMIAWLQGRTWLLGGRHLAGAVLIVLGLPVCTLLGALCKANGVLLPALVLLVEWAALGATDHDNPGASWAAYRRWMWVLAGLPALVVAAYLAYEGIAGFVRGISAIRPWTIGQRLLTEPRVLCEYLRLLWLPQPYTAGLFNDQIQASTSLWRPWTTLPALACIIVLIAAACRLRRSHPALACAILFYFVGQSMESSTVALELYFEHRNYLPAMLMFWPLALWLCGVRGPPLIRRETHVFASEGMMGITRAVLVAGIPVALAVLTWANADLWGNTRDQALLWAQRNPDSARAQANAANAESTAGRPDLAAKRLAPLVDRFPGEVQLALNLFGAQCTMGEVTAGTWAHANGSLRVTRDPGTLLANWFGQLIDETDDPSCPQADLPHLQALIASAAANPRLMAVPGRRQDLDNLEGRVALAQHDAATALANFDQALEAQPREPTAFSQAALLGAHGYPREGLAHLATFERLRSSERSGPISMVSLHEWILHRQGYWNHELVALRATLTADANALPKRPR